MCELVKWLVIEARLFQIIMDSETIFDTFMVMIIISPRTEYLTVNIILISYQAIKYS